MEKSWITAKLYIKLVILWILSWIPFTGHGINISISIQNAYQGILNDLRNRKIDKQNTELKEKGINLKNRNKKL